MSFILDALKKSELDRQRQSTPGLVDSGLPRPRAALPAWAIALCVLLAINLVVLLFVLIRGALAPQTAAVPPAAPASKASSVAGDSAGPQERPEHFSPLDPAPTYAPEIPVDAPRPPGRRSGAATSGGAASAAAASGRVPPRQDPLLTDNDYKAADEEVLPTVNEISLTGSQALPELHLDVHVYATRAADRFVYVNMRKYHEGATLQEGPTIERIRRDGVILNYHGLRFLLPRQ